MPERVVVVGLADASGATLVAAARRALEAADLVIGGRRHLDALAPPGARALPIEADVAGVLDAVATER